MSTSFGTTIRVNSSSFILNFGKIWRAKINYDKMCAHCSTVVLSSVVSKIGSSRPWRSLILVAHLTACPTLYYVYFLLHFSDSYGFDITDYYKRKTMLLSHEQLTFNLEVYIVFLSQKYLLFLKSYPINGWFRVMHVKRDSYSRIVVLISLW